VVGVDRGDAAIAFSLDAVSDGQAKATNTAVGNDAIVVFWKAGQASALDREGIDAGRDVGSVTVFLPEVNGNELTFTAVDDEFIDDQTGSTWNLAGEAIDGELAGERLEEIPHLDTFWFAWATYRPGTEFVETAE
jgi:hypothetical protein